MMRCQSLNLLTIRAKGNKWNTSLVLLVNNIYLDIVMMQQGEYVSLEPTEAVLQGKSVFPIDACKGSAVC